MSTERNFVCVNGLALGEETKGNTVQSIVRELDAHTVWRSGGWQGGHHIEHDDGREMAFSFYGAGTFEGADTYLQHMVISPVELFQEAQELEGKGVPHALSRMTVHQDCLTTTPFHSAISRTREILRGEDKKGTIGKGVGEAIRDAEDPELTIRAGDFRDRDTCERRAEAIRRLKLRTARELIEVHRGPIPDSIYDELAILHDEGLAGVFADSCEALNELIAIEDDSYLDRLLSRNGSIVNEVSHGILHHPRYGFVPNVTHIDPTSADVIETVRAHGYHGNISRVGVVRTYFTRHGAGPLVTHNPDLDRLLPENHNDTVHEWLGPFRRGNFDVVALNYALSINRDIKPVDGLVISFLDILSTQSEWDVCEAYEYAGKATDLDAYFHIQNGRIVGIKLRPDTHDDAHYQHQKRLTELLRECRPILTPVRPRVGQTLEDAFVSYVEARLDVPVVGKAYGPKLQDRHFLPSFGEILRSHR